jgi:hypothetical protein
VRVAYERRRHAKIDSVKTVWAKPSHTAVRRLDAFPSARIPNENAQKIAPCRFAV